MANDIIIKIRLDDGDVEEQIRKLRDELGKLGKQSGPGLKNTSDETIRLAKNLGVSYTEAKKFSETLGLTSSKTDQAVSKFRELSSVGASSADKFSILSKELGITKEQFDKIAPAASKSKESMAGVAGASAAVAVSLGAIAVSGIKAFADFDKAVNTFGVVTQSVGTPALAAVRAEIERLSAATTKTPQEIALVSVELGKAGFTAEQTKVALAGVVLASEATGEGLARTGEVVGSTLTQFGLAADQSGKIADLLTTASNASAAGTDDLGEALSYVGTQARASNQSVEDTITTLAQLANAGIKGSSAGTGLAEALRRLKVASAGASTELNDLQSKGSKNAIAAFTRLNAEVRDSEGKLKPFPQILQTIKGNLSSLEQGDKDLLMNALFGVQGGRTIESLLGQTEEKLNSVTNSMSNASGSAALASAQLTQGLGPALIIFGSSLSLASQKVGEFLAVGLTPLVQGASGVVNAFSALPPAIQLPILAIGSLTAAIAAAVAVGSAFELLQIRTKATLFVTTAATLADAAAKTLQTGVTTAAGIATGVYATQLNLASLGSAKGIFTTSALAVAKGILAGATGTATVAMLGFAKSTAVAFLPLTVIAATVAVVVDSFLSVGKSAEKQKSGLGDFEQAMAKLNETQLKNQGATINQVAADSIAIASNKRIADSIGGVQQALDAVRGKIGFGTALEAAANESKIAFGEVLATADTVQDRLQTVFAQKDLTKVSQEELANLTVAIEASKKAIESTQPADAADVKAKELRIKSLERLKTQLESVKKAQENQVLKKEGEELRKDPSTANDAAKSARLKEIDAQLKAINDKEKQQAEIAAIQLKITEAKAKLSSATSDAEKKTANDEINKLKAELGKVTGGAKLEQLPGKDKDQSEELKNKAEESKRKSERTFEDAKAKREQNFADQKAKREEQQQAAKELRQEAFDKKKQDAEERFEDAKATLADTRQVAKEARETAFEQRKQALIDGFEQRKQASAEAFAAKQQANAEAFAAKQQANAEAFSAKQSEAKKKFDAEIATEEKKINRDQQLKDADPKSRANLQKQFASEDQKAKDLEPLDKKRAEFEAKQLAEKKAEEEKVKAEKSAEEKRIAEEKKAEDKRIKEEEKKQAAELKALEKKEKEAEKAIAKKEKLEDRESEKKFKSEQTAAQKAFNQAEKTIDSAFKKSELEKERSFKNQEQATERAFKDAQRLKDIETAKQIKAIVESTKIPIPETSTPDAQPTGNASPIPRYTGGDIQAYQAYRVGERGIETFVSAVPGYIINHEDSMTILREQLARNSTTLVDNSIGVRQEIDRGITINLSNDALLSEIRSLKKTIENRNPKIESKVTLEGDRYEANLSKFYRAQRAAMRGLF